MVGKRLILPLALLLALPVGAQGYRDCGAARTQLAATDCAVAGWRTADAELNRLWKQVKPLADRRGHGKSLLNQQRAWLKYRDATCEGERNDFAGGSIAGQIWASCMERLTRVRNAELKALR